jgi:hypothetical protein
MLRVILSGILLRLHPKPSIGFNPDKKFNYQDWFALPTGGFINIESAKLLGYCQ